MSVVVAVLLGASGCNEAHPRPAMDAGATPDAGTPADAGGTDCVRGWCWEHPTPQGNDLHAVWGAGADDVWAVGDRGTILHYDGAAWTRVDGGSSANLRAIWGTGPADVWAVGDAGAALHYDGDAWARVGVPTGEDLFGVWGASAEDVWLVGAAGVALHRDGDAWTAVDSGTTRDLYAVAGADAGDVWAVGDEGQILHLESGAWRSVPSGGVDAPLRDVWVGADGVWAVGSESFGGAVLRFEGTSFRRLEPGSTREPTGPPSNAWALWGAEDDLWMVGDRYLGVHRREGGVFRHPSLPQWVIARARDAWGSRAEDVWVVGGAGLMIHYLDGAWSSSSADLREGRWWAGLGGSGPSDVWASSVEGLWRFDGSRWWASWSRLRTVEAVWASSPGDAWAVGAGGVQRFDGARWSAASLPPAFPPGAFLDAVWGSGPADVWVLGHTEDSQPVGLRFDGVSLALRAEGELPAPANAIWGSGPDDVWAALWGSGLGHFDGDAWATVATPGDRPLRRALGERPGRRLGRGTRRSDRALRRLGVGRGAERDGSAPPRDRRPLGLRRLGGRCAGYRAPLGRRRLVVGHDAHRRRSRLGLGDRGRRPVGERAGYPPPSRRVGVALGAPDAGAVPGRRESR